MEMDMYEVGTGDYVVLTVPRHGGIPVAQRFETHEEALAQHHKNVSQDRPLVE